MDLDVASVVGVLLGVGLMVAMVGGAFYFAARAERRRRERAAPDLLDVVDGIMTAGADLASAETRRRYFDPGRR